MSNKQSDELKNKTKIDFEKVLVEEIGQFGKFHIKIIAQCFFACVFLSWNITEFVFTAARIQTRCLIPDCDNPSEVNFAPTWITNAVPSNEGSLDNCQRFGNTSALLPVNDSCPASLFDTSVLLKCEEYIYENTNTLVYDFGLACEEWKRTLIGPVRILGMLVALAITGYISDRWGRRRALALNSSCAAVMGLVRYWAPNYYVYLLILFVESVVGCGSFTCCYVLIIEILGPKYRVVGAAILQTTFSFGQITLGLLAWAVTDWRTLTLTLYIPQLFCILYFWTRIESVRWLLSKGRFKDAEVLLRDAARMNGKQLSEKFLNDLRISVEAEMRKETETKDRTPLMLLVLQDRRILIRCIVSFSWWATSLFVYYGLSFNAVNLTGNIYFNYVLVSVVEIPGYWSAVLIINKIGRKPTLITSLWLCTACQVSFMFISDDLASLSLIFYMLGKFAISTVVISMNIFTLELYPTEYRNRLYNYSSMMGRLGSIVASLTPALAVTLFAEFPFILFGGSAFLSGLLTFLVPETLGSKLADTMEEALNIENNKQQQSPTIHGDNQGQAKQP